MDMPSDEQSEGAGDTGRSRRKRHRPFDLGRLLAAEMVSAQPDGSSASSDSEDAVSLPGSTGHPPAAQQPEEPQHKNDNELKLGAREAPSVLPTAGPRQPFLGGPSMAGQRAGAPGSWPGSLGRPAATAGAELEPDSWRSSLHAPAQASEEGTPLEAGCLGSWSDVLPTGQTPTGFPLVPDAAPLEGPPVATETEAGRSGGTLTGRSTQPAAGSSGDDFLISAVHHGGRGLSDDSRTSSR